MLGSRVAATKSVLLFVFLGLSHLKKCFFEKGNDKIWSKKRSHISKINVDHKINMNSKSKKRELLRFEISRIEPHLRVRFVTFLSLENDPCAR